MDKIQKKKRRRHFLNLKELIKKNREILLQIPEWIDHESYYESLDKYGLISFQNTIINDEMSNKLTIIDILCFVQQFIYNSAKRCQYIEMGVGLMRTTYCLIEIIKDGDLFVFDRNEMNPKIKNVLKPIKKEHRIEEYKNTNGNKLLYYKGNIYNNVHMKEFFSKIDRVNIIFSDVHLRGYDAFMEYKNFILSKLDERFILIYNTKNKIMKKECILIASHLKNARFNNAHIEIAEMEVYDSMGGEAGTKISICIISSINLETLLRMIGRRGNVAYNRVILKKNAEPNVIVL